jgi:hypothetical protein
MELPDDGQKYAPKHVAVIKYNKCKQLDLIILKYLLC